MRALRLGRVKGGLILLMVAAVFSTGSSSVAAQEAERKRISLNVEERKRKKKAKKDVPTLRRSAVAAQIIEEKLIVGINKTTSYLNRTASSLPKKSAQRLEIMERVLNLYMENASYVRNKEERSYDLRWRRWDANGRVGTEPRLDSTRSFGLWKKVIQQATKINQEYPRNKNADVVLYNKAVGLQYIGREREAAQMLSNLVEQYKGSAIAGDAYSSLGDYFFDRNDFRSARNNYQKALRYKRSKRYQWAIFKLGWCSFNLGTFKKAMEYWKTVVRIAKNGTKKDQQLKEEALRDLVYAFAELRQVEPAISYYRANGGSQYIGPFLTLLGEIFADQGQYRQAIKVYRRFLAVAPKDPEGPNAQKEIVNLFHLYNKLDTVWKELAKLHKLFNPKSSWAAAQQDRALVAETSAMIKDQIMYYSTLTHQRAIKQNNRTLNQQARKGYLLYLKSYPVGPEVPGVKYLLADIEYYLKNYREAGRYYFEIASLGKKKALRFNPVTKKYTNIHRESAIDMVRSYVKDFEGEFKVLRKRKPNFKKPRKLSLKARNYIKACGNYLKWYPKDGKRTKSCDTNITTIYYRSGIRKPAIANLRKLALKYPKEKEGKNAVRLVVPLLKDDKKNMLGLVNTFLKVPEYRRGKLGDLLRNLKRGAEKEAIVAEKDVLKRARLYEAQARKYPKDPDVDKLWFNAALDYMKGGAIDKSLSAHAVIVSRFPKTPQAKESLLTIARVQEKQLDFDAASNSFAAFARRYPKAAETAPALAKSCELQVALNSSQAVKTCLVLAKGYPENAKIMFERLIVNLERAGKYQQMADVINRVYLRQFRVSPNEEIVALKRQYDASNRSAALRNRMLAVYSKAPGSVEGEALKAIGQFNLSRVLPALGSYDRIRLRGGSVDNLAASIQQKLQALVRLEQSFAGVVQIKDAFSGVTAYVNLGRATESFAKMLENPPAIKGATKEEVLKELAPQIAEVNQAAAKWYQTAMGVVNQFKVYSRDSVAAAEGLARTRGKQLKFDDFVPPVAYQGVPVSQSWTRSLREI